MARMQTIVSDMCSQVSTRIVAKDATSVILSVNSLNAAFLKGLRHTTSCIRYVEIGIHSDKSQAKTRLELILATVASVEILQGTYGSAKYPTF